MATNPFSEWGRATFHKYRGCVVFVAITDAQGNAGISSAFHVGDGVFVTARHVVEGKTFEIGLDDQETSARIMECAWRWDVPHSGRIAVERGPYFHEDRDVDLACFVANPFPRVFIPLGGHLDGMLGQYELVLHQTLVLGYPPIELCDHPVLVPSLGEINALVDLYLGAKHPHFIVSSIARGGFSGGPALVAYNEANLESGTAVLGIVTQSLGHNDRPAELGYMAVLSVEPIYNMLEQHGLLPEHQKIVPDPRDFT